MAPNVKPLTRYLLSTTEKIRIGIIDAKAKSAVDRLRPPVKLIVIGITSFLLRTNAKTNSFQEKIKQNRVVTAIPGAARGKAMRQKSCQLLQPSIVAASSIATGNSIKKPLIIQTAKGKQIIKWDNMIGK